MARMSPLVQQGGHVIVNRQRAAASKRGIQLSVGVEPGNAAEIRPTVGKLKAADHDLSVRLHSQGLRGVICRGAERKWGVSKGSIQDARFAKARHLHVSVVAVLAASAARVTRV
jgi:hypothetical protein